MRPRVSAIVLAGGRADRLGGISKPDLEFGGSTLLQRALAAAASLCGRTVVVGPPELAAGGATVVREDPPFGGPVAALAAGLDALDYGLDGSDWVLVLPVDLPRAADAVALLAGALPRLEAESGDDGADGAHLVDAGGAAQWLTGIYRRPALRAAVDAHGQPGGRSMKGLVARLRVVGIPDPDGVGTDIDTWRDVARYRWRTADDTDEERR